MRTSTTTANNTMKLLKQIGVYGLISIFLISGCAPRPETVLPAQVDQSLYEGHDCDDLHLELAELNEQTTALSKKQRTASHMDSWGLGLGLFVVWPALLLMLYPNPENDLAQAKGEFMAAFAKAEHEDCDIAGTIREMHQIIVKQQQKIAEKKARSKQLTDDDSE